ncbi:MAG: type II toxin-antitoxin system RelE/ParE family toxin [bacterium]|nr:type II toxin-antitoxin system RelE/ParE family toxin [bacterium]
MVGFRLVPTRRFEDDFRGLPKDVQARVLKALERIQANPHLGRKLTGIQAGRWRFRAGDYRIRYDIAGPVVILHVVRHRKDIYR